MGDHWLYQKQDLAHLFYMKRDVGRRFNRAGHATSYDLLSWEEHDDITIHPHEGDWDYQNRITQTGYVVEHEGRYWMAYGSRDLLTQKIGWLVSDDLFQWHRPSAQPAMWPQTEYYVDDGQEPIEYGFWWRDPCFIPTDKGWDAFVCARANQEPPGGRGCIGRARSRDLLHWEYLPPIYAPRRYRGMEVPHYFELNGFHYVLFSTMSRKGIRLNSAKGQLTAGVYYCVSESYEGPYQVPTDHLLIGRNAYVGRHFQFRGEDLFTHLNQREHDEPEDRPTFALPKRFGQSPDGSLFLRFWPGAEALWDTTDRTLLSGTIETMGLPGEWEVGPTSVMGHCDYGPSAAWIPDSYPDFHLAFDVELTKGCRGSVLLRGKAGSGVIFTINCSERQFEIGTADGVLNGIYLHLVDTIPFSALPQLAPNYESRQFSVRLIARQEIVETYVMDHLIFTRSFRQIPENGPIGFAADTGGIPVVNLKLNPIDDQFKLGFQNK
jgi:beta-fructofuranosidase